MSQRLCGLAVGSLFVFIGGVRDEQVAEHSAVALCALRSGSRLFHSIAAPFALVAVDYEHQPGMD
jgi:hypothetical protein